MPESTFTASARTGRHRAAVWTALQDADTWAGLGLIDDVFDPLVDNGVLESFGWAAVVGGRRYQGTATVSERTGQQSMTIDLSTSEVGGTLRLDLIGETAGTRIEVTLTARSKGWLAGAFWGAISSALGSGLQDSVTRFAADL